MCLLCDVCSKIGQVAYGYSQVLCLCPYGQHLVVDEVIRTKGLFFVGDADY